MRFVLPLLLTACSLDLGPFTLTLGPSSTGSSGSSGSNVSVPSTSPTPMVACESWYPIQLESDGTPTSLTVGIALLGLPAEGTVHYRLYALQGDADVRIDGVRLVGEPQVDVDNCVPRAQNGEDTCTVPVQLELIPRDGDVASAQVDVCVTYAGNTWDQPYIR